MNEMREPVAESTVTSKQRSNCPPWLQRNNFARGSLPVNYPKHNEMLSGTTNSGGGGDQLR